MCMSMRMFRLRKTLRIAYVYVRTRFSCAVSPHSAIPVVTDTIAISVPIKVCHNLLKLCIPIRFSVTICATLRLIYPYMYLR